MSIQPPVSEEKEKNIAQSESRSALQRMIIVLAAAIGIIIYSYGWTVTEIDLALPQEDRRQENVIIALRELLSPRIFEQNRDVEVYTAEFLMGCETGDAPSQNTIADDTAGIIIEPTCANSDDIITFNVFNASDNAEARVRWLPPANEGEEARERPLEVIESEREDFIINTNGRFTGQFEVPLIRGGEGQLHTIRVLVAVPSGPIRLSEIATLVIDRMIQTIFMALVATTVAIPIAALISFFAARNLMREVRLTVGSLLLTFIVLILGGYLGALLLSPVVDFALQVGRGEIGGDLGTLIAFAAPIMLVVSTVFLLNIINSQNTPRDKRHVEENKVNQTLNTALTALVTVMVIAMIGGLGTLGGEQFSTLAAEMSSDESGILVTVGVAIIASFGNFLSILGELTELALGVVTAVITGFALSSIVNNWLGNRLRRTSPGLGHLLGVVFGAVSGAMLLIGMSAIGNWAALLGLFPPLVAGLLGGQVCLMIASRMGITASNNRSRQLLRQVIMYGGIALVFVFTYNFMSINRAVVNGILPPQSPAILFGIELPFNDYMLRGGILGLVLGGIAGGLAGIGSSFPLGNVLYNVSRTALNTVRSIEPLIMGLVFVVWVGIGPFAGVLALTLHSIAALGKLYSEQIENIDDGPIEALQSTGANQLQTIVYAVVPQIIPPYIAFTMYRWDINVRMSTIIGFVGGGGIGLLLQQQINLLRYREAGVAVLAIAIVVSILDYASASIRERLV